MSMLLNVLEKKQLKLLAQFSFLSEDLKAKDAQLAQAFIDNDNTDLLVFDLANLNVKLSGVEKAIKAIDKQLDEEGERINKAITIKANVERKEHVQKAVESIERAIKLRDKLTFELKLALEHEAKANITNRSIEQAPRLILGKCAHDLALFGSISNAHVIQPCTMADLKTLQSSIKD